MTSEVIPIVMATDENYLMPTYVTIFSMFDKSNEDTAYDVYVLVPGNTNEELFKDFYELASNYKNKKINFVNMGEAFSNVKMSIQHITMPTYYRLYITEILKKYNKCIYLDCDIIVNSDLTELYDIDLSDYYIAGVPAAAYRLEPNGNKKLCDILNIPSIDHYTNAGILVFNIEKIRKEIKQSYLLSLVDSHFPSQDQDIINKVFYKGIKRIPLKYNAMVKYKILGGDARTDSKECQIYTREEIKEARSNPVIIHYADKVKPWQSYDVILSEYWWDAVNRIPESYRKAHIDTLTVTGDFKKKTIAVFGSSTTTKILSLDSKIKVNRLVGRISIPSISSSDAIKAVDDSLFSSLDDWSKRMILHDIQKTAIDDLLSIYSDYIVIDNHESRFDLVEIKFGNDIVRSTDSILLRKFLDANKIKTVKIIKVSEISDDELDRIVGEFAARVQQIYSTEKIIINELFECKEYISITGSKSKFKDANMIDHHNENSDRIAFFLRKYFSECHYIPMPKYAVGSTEKPAPDNFTVSIYDQKCRIVSNIINSNGKFTSEKEWVDDYSIINEQIIRSIEDGTYSSDAPLISIIIPVFNSQDTITQCINSAIEQTLDNIEIICIDDCSTDRSKKILKEYEKIDKRIKLISYESNLGTSKARKDGILSSRGKFIMFMDSDDYLEPHACMYLYKTITAYNTDIVSFGASIINVDQPEYKVKWMTNFIKPNLGYIENEDIFRKCFIKKEYNHILWNKIVNGDLCREAFGNISDAKYIKGNDRYAYFHISIYAKSLYGIDTKLYYYRLGSGVSNENNISESKFDTYLSEYDICKEEEAYIINKNLPRDYIVAVDLIKREIYDHSASTWVRYIPDELKSVCFSKMADKFGISSISSGFASLSDSDIELQYDTICKYCKVQSTNTIKTIGIFYHRLSNGGIERVISCLIPGFINLGYKVVLILEERDLKNDFPIPDDTVVEVIPSSKLIKKTDYYDHAKAFENVILSQKIDIVLYQAASSNYLFFDGMITKYLGKRFMVSVHEIFSQPMVLRSTDFIKKISTYRIADCIHTLNTMEMTLWQSLGINSIFIRNPLTFDIESTETSKLDSNNIAWVGRFDDYQKCFTNAIDTFEIIHERHPEVKLYLVGKGVNDAVDKRVKDYVRSKNLSDSIIIPGYSNDVGTFYLNSSIYLCTSAYETYPMVMSEAMSFGLPVVTFEMSYLELLKNSRGYLSATQKNNRELANCVIELIENDVLRHELGTESRKAIETINNDDLFVKWKNELDFISNNDDELIRNEDVSNLVKTIMIHYKAGIIKNEIVQNNPVTQVTTTQQKMVNFGDFVTLSIEYIKKHGLVNTIKITINHAYRILSNNNN
jgi:lipopolysaccharide biosynthesis glycosyltransferase/glycosyltransferase involved in cell wall biosynthesis